MSQPLTDHKAEKRLFFCGFLPGRREVSTRTPGEAFGCEAITLNPIARTGLDHMHGTHALALAVPFYQWQPWPAVGRLQPARHSHRMLGTSIFGSRVVPCAVLCACGRECCGNISPSVPNTLRLHVYASCLASTPLSHAAMSEAVATMSHVRP